LGYQLLFTPQTLMNYPTQEIEKRFACSDKQMDYILLDPHGQYPQNFVMPKYFKTSSDHHEAKPFWAWDNMGVDPVGYVWRKNPNLAKQLGLSHDPYVINAYATLVAH
jgi:hypothetical protein